MNFWDFLILSFFLLSLSLPPSWYDCYKHSWRPKIHNLKKCSRSWLVSHDHLGRDLRSFPLPSSFSFLQFFFLFVQYFLLPDAILRGRREREREKCSILYHEQKSVTWTFYVTIKMLWVITQNNPSTHFSILLIPLIHSFPFDTFLIPSFAFFEVITFCAQSLIMMIKLYLNTFLPTYMLFMLHTVLQFLTQENEREGEKLENERKKERRMRERKKWCVPVGKSGSCSSPWSCLQLSKLLPIANPINGCDME